MEKAITLPRKNYPQIEHLLIDECQDISALEYRFLEKIPSNNVYFTGDERQCQPAGTKIKLRNGIIKNIEDIEVGDSVVWFDSSKSYLSGINTTASSIEKKVVKVAKRDFIDDNLITITTENNYQSKYTPNHIAYVRINGKSEYVHAVYLMCDKNNRFRIGKIPFFSFKGHQTNPWRTKMLKEGCCKIWILKVFKTDKEARVLETKLSYKYSIPQTCWQLDKVLWTEEDLDYIYDGLDTFSSAKKCLKEFNRDYDYPLLDASTEKSLHIHYAKNAVTEIFATNIMPEIMEVIVYDNNLKHKKRYEKIINVEYEYIKQPIKVYSLETEGGTYVADDIVTHNCIYGFKGCSVEYLVNAYKDTSYKTYFLIDNYRNGKNILRFAESLIASSYHISPSSNPMKKEDGEVITDYSFYDALEELELDGNWKNWFIITRTNVEIAKIISILDERGIPNTTFKKSDLDADDIEKLMSSDTVKVLTTHIAKGSEIENVIAVGMKTYNTEERNIAYVAATRAKEKLYWCPSIVKRGDAKIYGNQKSKKSGFKKKKMGVINF